MDEFNKLLELDKFSHAYLIQTKNMKESYPEVLKLVKKILCKDYKEDCINCNKCHLIDENIYDDYYLVNPETQSIRTDDLTKLFNKFRDKSINENGNRVYLIYGFERIEKGISNKILKFLEEPEDNIYGILLTENPNRILNTIKSRCQIIKMKTKDKEYDLTKVRIVKEFLNFLIENKELTITYYNSILNDTFKERSDYKEMFEIMNYVLLKELNLRYNKESNDFIQLDIDNITKLIKNIDKLSKLLDNNINLNLLLDRFIIEFSKEV